MTAQATQVQLQPRIFGYLRDPLYLTVTLIITLYLSIIYYVMLLRGVMTPEIHKAAGIGFIPVAPFPWANIWETPASYIHILDVTGRPGAAIFGLAILLAIVSSLLTGIFVSGVLYSRYRGYGAGAGAACAVGGGALVIAGVGCPTCLIPVTAAVGIVIPLVTLPLAGVEFLIIDVIVLSVLLLWFSNRIRKYLKANVPS